MSLKHHKRVLLAEIESTYGTDSSPLGSANAILCKNINITPLEAQLLDRNLVRPQLGGDQQLHAGEHVKITFDVELAGAGAAGTAPAYGPLLKACGMAETVNAGVSVEYSPSSSSTSSVTIYFNLDGQKHACTGARGTFKINLSRLQIPTISFEFMGIYVAPAGATLPTPTFTAFQQPLPVSNTNTPTFSLHGYAADALSLDIALGNTVVYEDLIGNASVEITDRESTGSTSIWAPALATKDFFAITKANTLGALQVIHGTTAGNKVQIDAPNVQLLTPNYGESNGVATLQIGLRLTPNTGDDELKLTIL
jgi:hypothetical protein